MGIDSNGNLRLQVVNGSFKDFCIMVRKENEEYYKKHKAEIKTPRADEPDTLAGWRHYFFVVDEINRGNLSNIFGETFTLLEYRDYDFSGEYTETSSALAETAMAGVIGRQIAEARDALKKAIEADADLQKELEKSKPIDMIAVLEENAGLLKDRQEVRKAFEKYNDCKGLIYKQAGDKVCFGIPFNIHFIGMMNDVDRSIDSFDLALRRRFSWKALGCDYSVIENRLGRLSKGENEVSRTDIRSYVISCWLLNSYVCGTEDKSMKDKDNAIRKYSDYIDDSADMDSRYQIGHAFFLKIANLLMHIKAEQVEGEKVIRIKGAAEVHSHKRA